MLIRVALITDSFGFTLIGKSDCAGTLILLLDSLFTQSATESPLHL